MEPLPSAPPVVAVVVASDPGDWLEQTLAALGGQDYPNLSLLVIDVGTGGDLRPRVGAVVPDAYVRRLEAAGYARAANEALVAVEGASYLLFCHDDAALLVPPGDEAALADALRALVDGNADRERRRRRGLGLAAGYTWEASAAGHAAVYRSVT